MSRSVHMGDNMDILHAALAIEHKCGVNDIYRDIYHTIDQDPVEYVAVYKMVCVGGTDLEICRVDVIMPADIAAKTQKRRDEYGGITEAIREHCPKVHAGWVAPRTREIIRDMQRSDASRARGYYRDMKRAMDAREKRLASGQADDASGQESNEQIGYLHGFGMMILMIFMCYCMRI